MDKLSIEFFEELVISKFSYQQIQSKIKQEIKQLAKDAIRRKTT
jgi:hypothetical protein